MFSVGLKNLRDFLYCVYFQCIFTRLHQENFNDVETSSCTPLSSEAIRDLRTFGKVETMISANILYFSRKILVLKLRTKHLRSFIGKC